MGPAHSGPFGGSVCTAGRGWNRVGETKGCRMKLLDPDHPFFALRWRRWATALFPLAWGAVELYFGNPGWAVLFGAAGVYAGYILLIPKR